MYELLKFAESEMESSSSDWSDEFDSFLTSFMLSAFDWRSFSCMILSQT